MMGVTIPPPVPPVPRPRNVPAPVAPVVSAPIPKGKGKGKGKWKSSQTPAPPPPSTYPSVSVVEAGPSAATLMAQANPPRQTKKPTPTPRGRAPIVAVNTAHDTRQTAGPAPKSSRNKKKNQKKKERRKLIKKLAREETARKMEVDQPAQEAMEANINADTNPPQLEGQIMPQTQSETLGNTLPPLPPRPQREQRSGRQASQPVGFAAWLLALWEKLSEVVSGVIRESASGYPGQAPIPEIDVNALSETASGK
ncbi:ESX-1 secretion-associated protein EspI-like [Bombyx mori]|uniref:Uncharacterized protein n=1 Tax=Bombyx mori TaxID=7091 RepID=A0A8R2LXB6_BOMMO|nr:ESX-1 secretion-associated protein EspI-like [Bombyx mori]